MAPFFQNMSRLLLLVVGVQLFPAAIASCLTDAIPVAARLGDLLKKWLGRQKHKRVGLQMNEKGLCKMNHHFHKRFITFEPESCSDGIMEFVSVVEYLPN